MTSTSGSSPSLRRNDDAGTTGGGGASETLMQCFNSFGSAEYPILENECITTAGIRGPTSFPSGE